MTELRRYRDEEIRRIFALATSGDDVSEATLSAHDGLTLSELQEVGRDVGIEPARVASAALVLDADEESLPRVTTLGMPTSVGRIVNLPRAVTDHEWDLLVTELRTTFRAKGQATVHGGVREWSNGNLHAFVEPTETGHRLRMTTLKGGAKETNVMAGSFLALALMFFVTLLVKDNPTLLVGSLLFALMGSGALAINLFGLRGWADEREQQMEYIANRAKALLDLAD